MDDEDDDDADFEEDQEEGLFTAEDLPSSSSSDDDDDEDDEEGGDCAQDCGCGELFLLLVPCKYSNMELDSNDPPFRSRGSSCIGSSASSGAAAADVA